MIAKAYLYSALINLLGGLCYLSGVGFAHADGKNVCRDKYWLTESVIALSQSGEQEEAGIGGTGHEGKLIPETLARREAEEGIGGTGIVGMIAGFGSLCIAGQEVFYDQHTPVLVNGQPASAAVFGLGQMVSVRAKAMEDSVYVATEIHVLHEVNGIVESLSEDGRSFTVLGQQIQLTDNSQVSLSQGQHVAVSGYRLSDGRIQATRLEPSMGQTLSLIGQVESVDEQMIQVAGQRIRLAEGVAQPSQGHEIRVEGSWEQGIFMIQSWQESPRLMFSMPVDRWVIQGQQPSLPEFIRKGDAVKTPIEHHLEKPNEVGQIKPDQFKPELSSHSDAINREVMNRPAPSPMFRPDIPHLDREPVPILRQERIDVWRNNIKPEGVRPEILKPERPDIPRERR